MSGSEPWLGPDPLPPTVRRRARRRALVAIAIVVIVAVATVSTVEVYQSSRPGSHSYPAPPPGWATFETAWSAVSDAFGSFANGSWTISFAEGVAADAPWSPPASLWDLVSPSFWDACAAQLSGVSTLTFWNASAYPYSTNSNVYSSGSAPLWTFIFNGTGTMTFMASWISGHVVINAVLGPTSPCSQVWVFDRTPYMPIDPSTEADSSAVAATVFAGGPVDISNGRVFVPPTPPSPDFAAYFPGAQFLPTEIGGESLWTVAYGECGMPGQLGMDSPLSEYFLNSTTAKGGLNGWGDFSCYDSYYFVDMNQTTTGPVPSPSGLYREWTLNASFFTSAVPPTWPASNLSTSLFHWQLTLPNPPFSQVHPTAANCTARDPGIANCTAPTWGWYAVLLGPSGGWLDSYPTVANGTAWSIPNLPVSSGDRILFVGSWDIPMGASFQVPYGGEPTVDAGAVLNSS